MNELTFSHLTPHHLSLSNLAGVTDETLQAVIPFTPSLDAIGGKIVAKLTGYLHIMKADMDKPKKNPLTKDIEKANNDCDATFNDIKRTVKISEQSTIPQKAEAGRILLLFLEPFWNLNKLPLATQMSMTVEMLSRYQNNAQLNNAGKQLDVDELFHTVDGQNSLLNDLYNKRLDDYAASSPTATSDRHNVEVSYGSLCTLVEQIVNTEPVPPQVITLFHKMDELRKKYAALSAAKINIKKAVTEPIATQKYTGKAITPLPEVYYEGKELAFAKDYSLTYHNNIEVGEATIIMHGKGRFNGQHERKFNIEK